MRDEPDDDMIMISSPELIQRMSSNGLNRPERKEKEEISLYIYLTRERERGSNSLNEERVMRDDGVLLHWL